MFSASNFNHSACDIKPYEREPGQFDVSGPRPCSSSNLENIPLKTEEVQSYDENICNYPNFSNCFEYGSSGRTNEVVTNSQSHITHPMQESPFNSLVRGNMQVINGEWKKIPRPLNAFMIYSNEKRKELKQQHPEEANNKISTRLGQLWKSLTEDQKKVYHEQAHKEDLNHRRKYPNYQYCPGQARRMKKARKEHRLQGKTATCLIPTTYSTDEAGGMTPEVVPCRRGRPAGKSRRYYTPDRGAQTYTTPSALAYGQKMTTMSQTPDTSSLSAAACASHKWSEEEMCYAYPSNGPYFYMPYEQVYGDVHAGKVAWAMPAALDQNQAMNIQPGTEAFYYAPTHAGITTTGPVDPSAHMISPEIQYISQYGVPLVAMENTAIENMENSPPADQSSPFLKVSSYQPHHAGKPLQQSNFNYQSPYSVTKLEYPLKTSSCLNTGTENADSAVLANTEVFSSPTSN